MAKIRVQMAPEIEFKMAVNIDDIDENSRDYDVQQHKAEIFAEFKRRLDAAFPEGYQMHGFEFGKDTGLHKVI
jgi:hypothetical protein